MPSLGLLLRTRAPTRVDAGSHLATLDRRVSPGLFPTGALCTGCGLCVGRMDAGPSCLLSRHLPAYIRS